MSLKTFHLIFITASIMLALGFGLSELRDYWRPDGRLPELLFGLGSLVASVGLVVYERYFLKKLKNVSYL